MQRWTASQRKPNEIADDCLLDSLSFEPIPPIFRYLLVFTSYVCRQSLRLLNMTLLVSVLTGRSTDSVSLVLLNNALLPVLVILIVL